MISSPEGIGLKPAVSQTIVVEGRDDQSAVLAAVSANVICTRGYGINQDTLDLLDAAYKRTGLIIFTDPDHAGRQIRERLAKLFPDAKHAYLTQQQAEKDGDIGIENAAPADIALALQAALQGRFSRCGTSGTVLPVPAGASVPAVTMEDLFALGLAGTEGSAERRSEAGAKLGIGSANAKTFLRRLSFMGIGLKELENALKDR